MRGAVERADRGAGRPAQRLGVVRRSGGAEPDGDDGLRGHGAEGRELDDLLGLAGGAERDERLQQRLAHGLGEALGAGGEHGPARALREADDDGVGAQGGGRGAGQGEGRHGPEATGGPPHGARRGRAPVHTARVTTRPRRAAARGVLPPPPVAGVRHLARLGRPVRLAALLPGLLAQARAGGLADGVGVGWYPAPEFGRPGASPCATAAPGPPWADAGLAALGAAVDSGCVLAGVRSAPGGPADESACPPLLLAGPDGGVLLSHDGDVPDVAGALGRLVPSGALAAVGSTTASGFVAALVAVRLAAGDALPAALVAAVAAGVRPGPGRRAGAARHRRHERRGHRLRRAAGVAGGRRCRGGRLRPDRGGHRLGGGAGPLAGLRHPGRRGGDRPVSAGRLGRRGPLTAVESRRGCRRAGSTSTSRPAAGVSRAVLAAEVRHLEDEASGAYVAEAEAEQGLLAAGPGRARGAGRAVAARRRLHLRRRQRVRRPARGLAAARGARVGTVASEYGGNARVLARLAAERGWTLVPLPVDAEGRVHDLPGGLDLLTLPQVASQRGLVQPVEQLRAAGARWCSTSRSRSARRRCPPGCAAYVGTSRKWLCGPRGVGFAVVAPDVEPALVDPPTLAPTMHPGVRRFELPEAHVAGRAGLAVALREWTPALLPQVHALAARARTVLGVGGWHVVEPVDEPSGITTLVPPDGVDPAGVRAALLEDGVVVSAVPASRAAELAGPVLRVSTAAWVDPDGLDALAGHLGRARR